MYYKKKRRWKKLRLRQKRERPPFKISRTLIIIIVLGVILVASLVTNIKAVSFPEQSVANSSSNIPECAFL